MSSGDFNIKKFDLQKIKDHKTLVVTGRRGTGKTTLITDLLYHKEEHPRWHRRQRNRGGERLLPPVRPGLVHLQHVRRGRSQAPDCETEKPQEDRCQGRRLLLAPR